MANQKPTFSAEACRIETSVRARIETGRIEHVQIFKRDQIPLGYEKLSSLSVNVVHGAWAKLLRSYVYSDTISFGTLRTSQDDGAGGILGRNRFSIEFDDARICQYHDISERKWGEWLPDVYQDISRHGFDETQINTAVHLWAAQRDLRAERGEKNTGAALAQCVSRRFLGQLSSFTFSRTSIMKGIMKEIMSSTAYGGVFVLEY